MARPLKFDNPKKLQEAIDAYYASCFDYARDMFGNRLVDKDEKTAKGKKAYLRKQVRPFTITGLAVALGTTRLTLIEYEKPEHYPDHVDEETRDELINTIKGAKEVCHAYAEEQLFIGKQATGPIFNLKNNYGWIDKTVQESEGGLFSKATKVEITFVDNPTETEPDTGPSTSPTE